MHFPYLFPSIGYPQSNQGSSIAKPKIMVQKISFIQECLKLLFTEVPYLGGELWSLAYSSFHSLGPDLASPEIVLSLPLLNIPDITFICIVTAVLQYQSRNPKLSLIVDWS